MQKRSLGRGLSSLFESNYSSHTETETIEEKNLVEKTSNNTSEKVVFLSISDLFPGITQPRKKFKEEEILNLAASIQNQGILQPLLVRKNYRISGEAFYEIVAGERRWRAAQEAGLKEVPVIMKEINDKQALEIALIENIQREDLSPLEEATAYAKLIEEAGYTQETLAQIIGKSRAHITNMLRLLHLSPTIKALVEEGKLSMGHARTLINQEQKEGERLAEVIIQKKWSVRQIEEYLKRKNLEKEGKLPRKYFRKPASSKEDKQNEKRPEIKSLEETLMQQIGFPTELDIDEAGMGKITIHIQSYEDLDEFFHKIIAMMDPIVVSEE